MAENVSGEMKKRLMDDLRKIQVFSDLPDDQLAWLAERFEEVRLAPGEVFAREGEPLDHLIVMLEGEVRFHREESPAVPLFTTSAGQISGLLPYSRLKRYPATGRTALPTRLLRLHRDLFPEMLQRMPQLGQGLVAIMSDRIREYTKAEQQRDKLTALGKLSAGLAHELNNPAAAAVRAVASLREELETVRAASLRLGRHSLSGEQREFIARFERGAGQRTDPAQLDPLAQSDREEQIATWLEGRHVPDAWKVAPVLGESGVEIAALESLATAVGDQALADALTRSASLLAIAGLIGEVETSVSRISDLVRAVKEYSYMDQAPEQEVDVHQGIESTLIILGYQLKRGVTVVRDYDRTLPRICAHGGELNQVWTNLIDNAIAAMGGQGRLHIRTAREHDCLLVEIADTGPGIPREIQSRIFEPFFTTKQAGEGTGLGLDTVYRIVTHHRGDIRFDSQPGDTRFQVRLPISQPQPQSNGAT